MLRKILILVLPLWLSACSTSAFTTENSEAAKANIRLAFAYQETQNIAKGKEKLLLAQRQAPIEPFVWYSTGYFLEKAGEIKAADGAYLHALKLAPNSGEAHNNYGTFLCRQGHYPEAVSHFIVATKDPNYLYAKEAYQNVKFCSVNSP